jgi:hypothetical protein
MSSGSPKRAIGVRERILFEGWQVKAAAYHLGYRHANDLNRALKQGQRGQQLLT